MNRAAAILALLLAAATAAEEPVPRAQPVDAAAEAPAISPLEITGPVEIAPAGDEAAAPQVISRSEQFRAIGGTNVLRGSVALLAEEAKDDLLRLTAAKDDWSEAAPRVPVTLVLHGGQGDPAPPEMIWLSLFFSDAGYDLRVEAHLGGRGIEREPFHRAVTTALIYERTLRGRPPGHVDTPFFVPPWLVDGLREAADWQARRGDRRPYETLFKSGGVYELAELFAVDEAEYGSLDAAMRAAFRVSSGALVMALLEQPDGKDGFRAFLAEVAAYQGEMPALLRRHFPGLNLSESSLAKWWELQMARNASATLTDVLSTMETEAALDESLRLHFRDADGITRSLPLEQWAEMPEMPADDLAAAVRPAQDALVRLSYRCFPSYRPLIAEYQLALASVARNATAGTAEQLAGLARARSNMLDKALRGRDFLDWFEITRARETSGAFDDYLRLKDRLKQQDRRRDDPLSLYLDRIERVFCRDTPVRPTLSGR
jgi:hypothetical protein